MKEELKSGECPRCGYHIILHSLVAECARCDFKTSWKEYNKNYAPHQIINPPSPRCVIKNDFADYMSPNEIFEGIEQEKQNIKQSEQEIERLLKIADKIIN